MAAGLDIDAAAGSYKSTGGGTDKSSAADNAWSTLPEGAHERGSVQLPIDAHLIEACENLLESYLMQVWLLWLLLSRGNQCCTLGKPKSAKWTLLRCECAVD